MNDAWRVAELHPFGCLWSSELNYLREQIYSMTGNEEGKQHKLKVVSVSSQAGPDHQSASAIPLGDVTSVSQNVETSTPRKDMVEETEELNSSGVTKLLKERDQLASGGLGTEGVGCVVNESLHDPSVDVTKNSPSKDTTILPERVEGSYATGSSSCHICAELNNDIECSSESFPNDPSKNFLESGLVEVEVIQSPKDPLISEQPNLAVTVEPVFEGLEICPGDGTNCLVTEQFELPVEAVSNLDYLETASGKAARDFGRTDCRNKRNTTRVKTNYMLRSSLGNKRSLRSRVGQKSKILESNNRTGNAIASEESKHIRRKEQRTSKVTADEYLRIRKNLSYMLNRIGYECSLIDAYSSEGWKGLRYVILSGKMPSRGLRHVILFRKRPQGAALNFSCLSCTLDLGHNSSSKEATPPIFCQYFLLDIL